jgi:hypothetical protein
MNPKKETKDKNFTHFKSINQQNTQVVVEQELALEGELVLPDPTRCTR